MTSSLVDPGQWLQQECRALGITLHRVALEARLSPSTVHRWVSGERTPYWHAFERARGVIERIRESGTASRPSFWAERRAK